MDRPLTIMAVYAHPADTATEASGTLALHAERGDKVISVCCTYGERHHIQLLHDEEQKPEAERDPAIINITLEQYRQLKAREARRIAAILGITELIFLGWTDHEVDISREKALELAALIAHTRPDIIITHMPVMNQGVHESDHQAVGRLVLRAIGTAWNRIRQFDGVEPYHGVKQVFFFATGGDVADSRDFFNPGIVCDVWVDTTRVIHKKVQAFDQLVSQGYQGTTARKVIEARDGRWGMLAGCSYAEPFLRPSGITYDYLPMPDRVRNRKYVANDLPGDTLMASHVPLATPADAFTVPTER